MIKFLLVSSRVMLQLIPSIVATAAFRKLNRIISIKTISIFPVLVSGMVNTAVLASDDIGQKEIRRLVEQGRIMPLEKLLQRYPEKKYGRLLDLEVEREHGAIVYEFEFLRRDGQVLEIEVDASNGRVLKQEIED